MLDFRRELSLRLLVLSSAATMAWFWLWWLSAGHGQWSVGTVVVTMLLLWVFALPAYFFFFIVRMTRPNPAIPVPRLRVAMVVTKAPSEPWPLLQRTLEGMLSQEFPRRFDVWLADECPSGETRRWCAAHGVQISTRLGVEEYHRPVWPRRTRCKEGNLAYFYDHVGYHRYDVVVQLDADHVPGAGYLENMVRPFADPHVGYVAAPSICDSNVEEGWTVRGRLFRESSLHGPVQAGSNNGWAPVCIGSHYAVRTAALRSVGGIGPELAEDYSTTLWLQSGGWDGVFTIDAEAHGEGPATLEEMITQELQWARSLCTILVRWAPDRLRSAPWRARRRLGFALAFYPLQAAFLALAAIIPTFGVIVGASWAQTSFAGFYVHLWPNTVVTVAAVAYMRRQRLLRPTTAKLWSWELMMFMLIRWPWNLWGVLQGMYAGCRSRVMTFKVTPKADEGVKPLRPKFIVPTLLLGAIPGWVVVVVDRPGSAIGLAVIAALQASAYLVCASAAVALHIAGNRRRIRRMGGSGWGLGWASGGGAAAVTALVTLPTVAALCWRVWIVGLRP